MEHVHNTQCHHQYLKTKNEENIIEPAHNKNYKNGCEPSEDSDQPGHLPSFISLRCSHEESLGP